MKSTAVRERNSAIKPSNEFERVISPLPAVSIQLVPPNGVRVECPVGLGGDVLAVLLETASRL